jgi:hypothetical protein
MKKRPRAKASVGKADDAAAAAGVHVGQAFVPKKRPVATKPARSRALAMKRRLWPRFET